MIFRYDNCGMKFSNEWICWPVTSPRKGPEKCPAMVVYFDVPDIAALRIEVGNVRLELRLA